jgi:hypothetical protein
MEATPACCGTCPTCITATAGTLLLPMLVGEHKSDTDE